MLKITHKKDEVGRPTLVLEGQVAGRWVAELRDAYAGTEREGSGPLTLDLKDVMFIDDAGLAFFEEVGSAVTLINCSLFAAEQLKGVTARHHGVAS
jgi:anti-anti-sigma regulatory factor